MSLMPCPSTGSKMFWACPNFLCQTKDLFTYCGSHKHFVPDKKICAFSKFVFSACTKFFGAALNAIQFLVSLKTSGPVQNILEPVEGQGKSTSYQLI